MYYLKKTKYIYIYIKTRPDACRAGTPGAQGLVSPRILDLTDHQVQASWI
jgi:hypothetical protein